MPISAGLLSRAPPENQEEFRGALHHVDSYPVQNSLLGETVEFVRGFTDIQPRTRGTVRAVYASVHPDRVTADERDPIVYCLIQLLSGNLISVEAQFLRVIPRQDGGRVDEGE